MNLAELKTLGGIVTEEPVKQKVEWKEHSFDVHVKRLSFGDVEAIYGNPDDESKSARMISKAILLGEELEPISYEDALRLDVSLATKLIEAFNIANGMEKKIL